MTEQAGDHASQPGSIDIQKFTLTNFDQSESHDIRLLAIEWSVYASLFCDHIRGEIVMEDALSLPTRMPIVGEETMQLSFKTPTMTPQSRENPTVDVQGRIISLEKLTYTNVRSPMYLLTFVHQSRIVDLMSMLRTSFGPDRISELVKKIAKDYLKIEGDKIEIEETVGKHKFVAPAWSPVETMRYLAREAFSEKYKASNFLFWSDWEKHYFKTVESLIEQTPADDATYYFTEQSVDPTDANANSAFNFINHIQMHQFFNIERAIEGGLFDNKVLWVDTLMQQYEAVRVLAKPYYSYLKDQGQLKHIADQPNLMISDKALHGKGQGDSHVRFLHANPNQTWEKFQVTPRKRQEKLPFVIAQTEMLNAIMFHITVPGDTRRKPGDIIRIDVPEFGATDDIIEQKHRYLRGRYLVTAVRHKFNHSSGFQTVMEVVKNAIEDKVARAPAEKSNAVSPAEIPPLPDNLVNPPEVPDLGDDDNGQ